MELEYKWKKRLVRLPDFIDNMDENDYWLWLYLRAITESIYDLCFIKNPDTNKLIGECNKNMRYIENLLGETSKKYLGVIVYLVEFYDDILEDMVENEMFEAAARLKKLDNNFYVKK